MAKRNDNKKMPSARIAEILNGQGVTEYALLVFDFPTPGGQTIFHYRVMPVLLYDGDGARARVACSDPERVRRIAKECQGKEV